MKKNYCTKCGSLLIATKVGAEMFVKIRGPYFSVPYDAYDRTTGTRNYAIRYRCPKKGFFSSNHDDFGKMIATKPKMKKR